MDKLQNLAARYDMESYTAAMIHKFNGLASLLILGNNDALRKLDEVIKYFDQTDAPMFKLIEASLRASRMPYFLKTRNDQAALADLREIVHCLTGYKPFKIIFTKEIDEANLLIKRKKIGYRSKAIYMILDAIIKKIPY